jgi:hypothetical protein
MAVAGSAVTGTRDPERPIPADLIADVLWRREGETSLEHFRLSRMPDFYALQGILLSRAEASPRQIHYVVSCNLDWLTRAVHVTVLEGPHIQRLQLERDESGVWRSDSRVLAEFEGLSDVDLQITPATNTLPIRRLNLGVGDAAETDAVWIRFPELTLERLAQRYTRTANDRYRYESRGGAFRADLDVDEHGVVVRYGDIWQRVSV